MLSFGDPTPYIDAVKESGSRAACQVQTLPQAKQAATAGADIIVAQGRDAGGHAGITRGTLGFVRIEAASLNYRDLLVLRGQLGHVREGYQIEYHPFLAQGTMLAYLRSKGIPLTAYAPLAQGARPRTRRSARSERSTA